jgi:hypothetical protein
MGQLVLKRATASRPSGEWNDDDYDMLCDGIVVGRIMKAAAVPVGLSWMWTLAFGHHEDRSPTHGYAATREDAMAAFAKSWRRAWKSAAHQYQPRVSDGGVIMIGTLTAHPSDTNADRLRAFRKCLAGWRQELFGSIAQRLKLEQ